MNWKTETNRGCMKYTYQVLSCWNKSDLIDLLTEISNFEYADIYEWNEDDLIDAILSRTK